MVQGHNYIFAIQDKNFNFYQLVNGAVSLSNTPYFLDFSPAGWDDIGIKNILNKRYWAIDRTVSIPLAYVKDGATIIKDILYRKGIYEETYLVIAEQQLLYTPGVEYGFWYQQLFRGEIDLAAFLHTGARVTASTLESGLPKYLKANENTTEDIPAPDLKVKMDGINLHNKVENLVTDGVDPDLNYYTSSHLIPITIVSQDAPYVAGKKSVPRTKVTDNPNIKSTEKWFLTSSVDGIVNFNYDFPITTLFMSGVPNPAADYRIAVRRIDAAGVSDLQTTLFYISPTGGLGRFNQSSRVTGAGSIVVRPGDELYLVVTGQTLGAGGLDNIGTTYSSEDPSFFNYTYLYLHPTTYIDAWSSQLVFTWLCNKFTEGKYSAAVSAYLKKYSDIAFTSGNALRGIADSVLKLSFSDFFQFFDSIDAVALLEVAGKIDIDRKENTIDTVNYIDIGSPAIDSFKVSIAKDRLFNELEIGGPDISNEVGVLNGKDDFTTKFLFTLGATNTPAKLDKVSKVKISPYEIEKTRIATFEKDTTDYKSDNDPFAIHIEKTVQPAAGDIPAHYKLDRSLNPLITAGLTETATIFNIFFSPGRSLWRNASFLHSLGYKFDTKTLVFKSALRNSELVCAGLIEKENVNIGSLDPAFVTAIDMEGDFPVPPNILSLLSANPKRVLRFEIDGNYYFGKLLENTVAPSSRKVQSYKMMSLPINDHTKLIDYHG